MNSFDNGKAKDRRSMGQEDNGENEFKQFPNNNLNNSNNVQRKIPRSPLSAVKRKNKFGESNKNPFQRSNSSVIQKRGKHERSLSFFGKQAESERNSNSSVSDNEVKNKQKNS